MQGLFCGQSQCLHKCAEIASRAIVVECGLDDVGFCIINAATGCIVHVNCTVVGICKYRLVGYGHTIVVVYDEQYVHTFFHRSFSLIPGSVDSQVVFKKM